MTHLFQLQCTFDIEFSNVGSVLRWSVDRQPRPGTTRSGVPPPFGIERRSGYVPAKV